MSYPLVNLGQTSGLERLSAELQNMERYLEDYCTGPEPVHDCDAVREKHDNLLGAYLELQRGQPTSMAPTMTTEAAPQFSRVQQMNENPYSWNAASGQSRADCAPPSMPDGKGGCIPGVQTERGRGYGGLLNTAMNFAGGGRATPFTMGRRFPVVNL